MADGFPARSLPSRAPPLLTGYGLVGDGRSAALVATDGSVDWWCPGRFDEASVFARILDPSAGHFHVAPPVRHAPEMVYEPATAILAGAHRTADATLRHTTFMAHVQATPEAPQRLVRILACERGPLDVTLDFAPRFAYGKQAPRLKATRDGIVAAAAGDPAELRLVATVPLALDDSRATGTFQMAHGERHAFILEHGPQGRLPPAQPALEHAFELLGRERAFWREWSGRGTYHGPHREEVERSLVTLKLLQHVPSGAFVAAPTMSLPEEPGGARNWDYRYAWLRDGIFTVMAFETAGFVEEPRAFKRWLAGILRRDSPDAIQMLYRVDGDPSLPERDLAHLRGYRDARPVRVGNAAAEQHQLDTYGEVLMCLHRADEIFEDANRDETWRAVCALANRICASWHEGDSGLWEMRGRHRQYVYSKTMAALALDHAVTIARKHGFDAPIERWRESEREIRAWVMKAGDHPRAGGFVQARERDDMDASNLLIGLLGFLPPEHARVVATLACVEDRLSSGGLLYRYIVDDDLPGNEGAFLAASFWASSLRAATGDTARAAAHFRRAAAVAGPLGLLPEEADPQTGEPLGNYPQALSHLGLVLAAFALQDAEPDAAHSKAKSAQSPTT